MPPRVVHLAFLGFGAVNQALHALLARRREALAREHGVECIVTGVASRRLGWRAKRAGLDPLAPAGAECADVREWLAASAPDVVFEAIPLDPTGDDVRRAAAEGRPIRLVGEVERDVSGAVRARVAPVRCAPDGPLGVVRGATLVMHYEADVFPGGLTVSSRDPDPTTTAYGMLADLVGLLGSWSRAPSTPPSK